MNGSHLLDGPTLGEDGGEDMNNIEFEYVSLEDKESVLAPGRVRIFQLTYLSYSMSLSSNIYSTISLPQLLIRQRKPKKTRKQARRIQGMYFRRQLKKMKKTRKKGTRGRCQRSRGKYNQG